MFLDLLPFFLVFGVFVGAALETLHAALEGERQHMTAEEARAFLDLRGL